MADNEYNPPLLLSHLRLFKEQVDKAYASKAEIETITDEQIDELFPEIWDERETVEGMQGGN